MSLKEHMILGGLASAALYPAIGANALFFWLASFLIDIDHYIDYVYHNGFTDFSVKRMFDYHDALTLFWKEPEFLNIEIFHTVEFLTPFYILSAMLDSNILQALFWGFIFHIVLDMIFLWRLDIFFKRTHSVAEYFLRRRLYARRGLKTVEIYSKAVEMVRRDREVLKAADEGR